MRNTLQRKMILNAVLNLHTHPTAEDVYQELQKEHPSISKSTVYRNLHQLAEDGEIRPVLMPDSPERFDDRVTQHYHFCCKRCGAVLDVDLDYRRDINEAVQAAFGFQVDEHDIFFKGTCPECTQNEEK